MKGCELLGSTKRKFNLPLGANCDSREFDKMNYSIPCPSTKAKRTCMEESLNLVEHGVAYTISMLEIDCLSFHWHIVRVLPNSTKRCSAMQADAKTLCNAKVITTIHGTPTHTYRGLMKEYRSTRTWSTIVTSTCTLQFTPTTRSCGYLNLQVFESVSNI